MSLCVQAGGFYSAEDADSLPTADATEKKEGAFCVWTWDEVQANLTEVVQGKPDLKEADVFCRHYGVKQEGNVDPYQVRNNCLLNFKVMCFLIYIYFSVRFLFVNGRW